MEFSLPTSIHPEDASLRCAYCWGAMVWPPVGNRTDITLDHVVPRSRGGEDSLDNTVWACRSCNSAKGTKSAEDFWASRDDQRRAVAQEMIEVGNE